ncbi:MAG: glycosyltransferase family 2 protein, partial [Promethearchaeota archaeon]
MNKMIHTTVPSVSVVIPTHNRRELLKCTIESLFNHSYPKDRYEIIVIDNASSDGTEKMIQS